MKPIRQKSADVIVISDSSDDSDKDYAPKTPGSFLAPSPKKRSADAQPAFVSQKKPRTWASIYEAFQSSSSSESESEYERGMSAAKPVVLEEDEEDEEDDKQDRFVSAASVSAAAASTPVPIKMADNSKRQFVDRPNVPYVVLVSSEKDGMAFLAKETAILQATNDDLGYKCARVASRMVGLEGAKRAAACAELGISPSSAPERLPCFVFELSPKDVPVLNVRKLPAELKRSLTMKQAVEAFQDLMFFSRMWRVFGLCVSDVQTTGLLYDKQIKSFALASCVGVSLYKPEHVLGLQNLAVSQKLSIPKGDYVFNAPAKDFVDMCTENPLINDALYEVLRVCHFVLKQTSDYKSLSKSKRDDLAAFLNPTKQSKYRMSPADRFANVEARVGANAYRIDDEQVRAYIDEAKHKDISPRSWVAREHGGGRRVVYRSKSRKRAKSKSTKTRSRSRSRSKRARRVKTPQRRPRKSRS